MIILDTDPLADWYRSQSELARKAKEAIQKFAALSKAERLQWLKDHGFIDEDGNLK